MPAVSSESSMERMPEPWFSHTVRVSPGSGTSSSRPPRFLMTSLSGYISTWVCVLRALLDRSRWTSVLTTASPQGGLGILPDVLTARAHYHRAA
jgi:hypothetical protein